MKYLENYDSKNNNNELIMKLFDQLYNEKLDIIGFIKQHKIDIDAKYFDMTILTKAANVSNYEICVKLIENGANIHYIDGYNISIIMRTPDIRIMKLLIDNGIDLDVVSSNGNTDLMYRSWVSAPDIEKIDLLIDSGANIDIKSNGNTFYDMLPDDIKKHIRDKYPEKYKRILKLKKMSTFNI